jgi:hypothetical protein
MRTVGVTMVRNEEDVIEDVIRHMATQVDGLLIADNLSTDRTPEILKMLCKELPAVSLMQDREEAYFQSRKMTKLAKFAADMTGCEWIVPFDADEIWSAGAFTITEALALVERKACVVQATLHDHVPSKLDDPNLSPMRAIRWRRKEKVPLPKVAFRVDDEFTIDQGNHAVFYPHHDSIPSNVVTLEVDHFPWRSGEQFVRKAVQGGKALAATDLPETSGQHWRDYHQFFINHGPEATAGIFTEWFSVVDPRILPDLEEHPAPLAF